MEASNPDQRVRASMSGRMAPPAPQPSSSNFSPRERLENAAMTVAAAVPERVWVRMSMMVEDSRFRVQSSKFKHRIQLRTLNFET